jgi:hypothetical protein
MGSDGIRLVLVFFAGADRVRLALVFFVEADRLAPAFPGFDILGERLA